MNNKDYADMVARRDATPEDYLAAVKRLESDKAIQHELGRILTLLSNYVCPDLDVLKKYIFYGHIDEQKRNIIDKKYHHAKSNSQHQGSKFTEYLTLGKRLVSSAENLSFTHVVTGLITEGGETIDALRNTANGDHDPVNWAEELGDHGWYNTLGINLLNLTREKIQDQNDKKLEKRQRGKTFNAENTINRDTSAERTVLEKSLE